MKISALLFALIAVALLGLLSGRASAQPADTARPRIWIAMGIGGRIAYDGGIAGGISLSVVDGSAFYGLRYVSQGIDLPERSDRSLHHCRSCCGGTGHVLGH